MKNVCQRISNHYRFLFLRHATFNSRVLRARVCLKRCDFFLLIVWKPNSSKISFWKKKNARENDTSVTTKHIDVSVLSYWCVWERERESNVVCCRFNHISIFSSITSNKYFDAISKRKRWLNYISTHTSNMFRLLFSRTLFSNVKRENKRRIQKAKWQRERANKEMASVVVVE